MVLIRVVLLLSLIGWSGGALAWGADGHRLVGAYAQARLSPAALAAVTELLAGESDPSLAGVSTWADQVRADDPDWRWSAPLHYINFEQGDCEYRPQQQCPDGLCIVAAITRYSQQMIDADLPIERRREALKLLVHFVGDLHQPLHAGYRTDRGGNQFQISYQRQGWNLHSVWDSLLISSLKLEWTQVLERLESLPRDSQLAMKTRQLDPAEWARESCTLVNADGFYPPRHRITRSYIEAQRPRAELQLQLAGERLAALLNQQFAAHIKQ